MPRKRMNRLQRAFYVIERERKLEEQGGRCIYCGGRLSRKEATVDHKIPISQCGGYHSGVNAVVACFDCNQKKGATEKPPVLSPFEQMLADMAERIEQRIRRAEYALAFDSKGSFRKWAEYHEKRGRWRR